MIKSMTGYGVASFENGQISIDIEIKTLNSKFVDIAFKLPKEVSMFENEIKKIITEKLVRGKVNFSVELSFNSESSNRAVINKSLFEHYKSEIQSIDSSNKLTATDISKMVLNMPEVFEYPENKKEAVDKKQLLSLLDQVLRECDSFRIQEGKSAEVALTSSSESIALKLEQIKVKDPERLEGVKSRISESLNELPASGTDTNRFEQELIYYIEKLDISEEIIRLKNHLAYFKETLNQSDSQGKKLGFISQEMGREINTIGSKANNFDIQKLVVDMKDELEKIKEQILNVV